MFHRSPFLNSEATRVAPVRAEHPVPRLDPHVRRPRSGSWRGRRAQLSGPRPRWRWRRRRRRRRESQLDDRPQDRRPEQLPQPCDRHELNGQQSGRGCQRSVHVRQLEAQRGRARAYDRSDATCGSANHRLPSTGLLAVVRHRLTHSHAGSVAQAPPNAVRNAVRDRDRRAPGCSYCHWEAPATANPRRRNGPLADRPQGCYKHVSGAGDVSSPGSTEWISRSPPPVSPGRYARSRPSR